MDMHEASRILSMDILGLSPEDFAAEREDDDYPPCEYDDTPSDHEHATGQAYTITICFDADTELEALLIASDILVRTRRTTARNVAAILT